MSESLKKRKRLTTRPAELHTSTFLTIHCLSWILFYPFHFLYLIVSYGFSFMYITSLMISTVFCTKRRIRNSPILSSPPAFHQCLCRTQIFLICLPTSLQNLFASYIPFATLHFRASSRIPIDFIPATSGHPSPEFLPIKLSPRTYTSFTSLILSSFFIYPSIH